jgi:hypothetical protein
MELLGQPLSKDITDTQKNFMGMTPKTQYLQLAAKVRAGRVL